MLSQQAAPPTLTAHTPALTLTYVRRRPCSFPPLLSSLSLYTYTYTYIR